MLVLTRRADQSIRIGDDIRVVVLGVSGDTVRLGIEAPRHIAVLRYELIEEVQAENRQAAAPASSAQLGAILGSLAVPKSASGPLE